MENIRINQEQLVQECDDYNCSNEAVTMVKYKMAYGLYCKNHGEYHQGMLDIMKNRLFR